MKMLQHMVATEIGNLKVNCIVIDANFLNLFHQSVSESDWLTVHILRQVLNIRDGTSVQLFSDGSTLLHLELDSFIQSLATSRVL